jgi:hypothetical protein
MIVAAAVTVLGSARFAAVCEHERTYERNSRQRLP